MNKLRDEGRAADLIELIPVAQHLRQRDEIDRLIRVPQFQQQLRRFAHAQEGESAPRLICFSAHSPPTSLGRQEERREHALLGVGRLWE